MILKSQIAFNSNPFEIKRKIFMVESYLDSDPIMLKESSSLKF